MADNIEIPKGWVETTLEELIYPVSETHKFKDFERVHFLNTGDILAGKLLHLELSTISKLPGQAKKVFNQGDILFSEIRPENKRYMLVDFDSKKSVASTKLMVLRTKIGIDTKFVYQFLTADNTIKEFQAIAESRSGTFPQITFDAISYFKILLPPLTEQQAIARMLSSFDDKIELLREQNETLEKMAQTIFQEWFGKYSIDDELPEGWRMGKMIEFLGEFESGRRPKGGVSEIKSGIPSIGAEYVKGLITSNFSNVKLIPKDFFNEMKTGKIKDNDILVYKDGGSPGEFKPNFTLIGEGYPFEIGAINEHVFRIQTIKNWQQYFLYFWLNGRVCIGELKSIGGKAAIPGINGTDFKNLSLLIPNEEYLVKFHLLIQPIMKKILKNNLHIQFLSKTRDELLPKLMNGEILLNNKNK